MSDRPDVPDGTYTVVVDRIEDGLAALEVRDGDDSYELLVEPAALPADARHANAVVDVEIVDGEIVDAVYDAAETDERRSRAQSRFDRLARRPPPSTADSSDDESGSDSAGDGTADDDEQPSTADVPTDGDDEESAPDAEPADGDDEEPDGE
ncbi:DUF3006 domain-containing protein [Halobaculum litoreum]|uniref:DUF3006 domain-containing protein n=1 Tax=Halobaculum litoreum TaxID=3031998 RepID=UPI0024C3A6BB|nr:DUF3006 domain-containing protein [Halobaculum sp. DT92]